MSGTEIIINPSKDKHDPELPSAGLLLINPSEAKAGMRLAETRDGQRHFLFNSKLSIIPENKSSASIFIAGPAVGSPMAVLTLEKLIALGAQRIITFGWCGSLSNTLQIGDVLLPTWATSNEGTSAHYPVSSRPESHAPTRDVLADGLNTQGLAVHSGPVWTTDAPYRESRKQVARLGGQGVLGVDMEFAALAAAASFRNIELTAVLLVSDELWSGQWKPGFRSKKFKKINRDILSYLIEIFQKIVKK
jgi:uridine phosphorylase